MAAATEPWLDGVLLDHSDVPCKEVIIKGDDIDLRRGLSQGLVFRVNDKSI